MNAGAGPYPILDDDTCRAMGAEPLDLVALWSSLGLTYFQWRAKSLTKDEYVQTARRIKDRFPDMAIFANDDWKSFIAHRDVFSGLHLGQEDLIELPDEALKELASASCQTVPFAFGLSTHNDAELDRSVQGRGSAIRWSYLAVGPCFPTSSKKGLAQPVLTQSDRRRLAQKAAQIAPTVVFIGGISASNASKAVADFQAIGLPCGRAGLAVIGAATTREGLLPILNTIRMLDCTDR